MILGTANFGNKYRNVLISKNECFKLYQEFENLGGSMVQCADNYSESYDIFWEYVEKKKSKLMMLYKINDTSELFLDGKKVGHSLYYPSQLNQFDKIIEIPNCKVWDEYLPIMHLHSKIYVRSNYTINDKYQIRNTEFIDDYIVGVENIEQLKENMKRFK